MQTALIEPSTI